MARPENFFDLPDISVPIDYDTHVAPMIADLGATLATAALARKMGVCIILIHHSGKDTMLGARGSSALFADVDFNLEIIDHREAKRRDKKTPVKPGSLERDDPEMLRRIPVHDHYLQPELVGKGHEAPPTPDRPLSSCNVPSLPIGALRVVTLSVMSE